MFAKFSTKLNYIQAICDKKIMFILGSTRSSIDLLMIKKKVKQMICLFNFQKKDTCQKTSYWNTFKKHYSKKNIVDGCKKITRNT